MNNVFEFTLQHRKNLLAIIEGTPKKELLKIPMGFNNNIWWNIAHTVVTQQLLLYKLSGLEMRVPDELVQKFKKGTVPEGTATDVEIKQISSLLIATVTWAQEDYENGLFKNYNAYTTSAKVTLKNVEDALTFNMFHEGLHLGSILALKKAVR